MGYARTVDDSVRNKDDKRKRQRQAAKERKQEEKVKKLEDLKRAKNIKKKEIFDRLKQIQEITGNKSKAVVFFFPPPLQLASLILAYVLTFSAKLSIVSFFL